MTAHEPDHGVIQEAVLGEEIAWRDFPCGLRVYAVCKPEFTRSYATLGARYGSVDLAVRQNGSARRIPDGTAHFLEHKMFETKAGDAFDLFARHGGYANAATSFNSTQYLFSTGTDYASNLKILLDLVLNLEATPAGIEKEKGIIAQEISMYDDDPDWRLYFGLLQGLYARHPVRIDIAGTAETIGGIDLALLEAIHRQYYHPQNLVLAAVSPEPESVTMALVEESLRDRAFGEGPGDRAPLPVEPEAVHQEWTRVELAVTRPRLAVGYKDVVPPTEGRERLRFELASAMAADCIFGSAGPVYQALYEQGLLDDSFYFDTKAAPGYAYCMVGGETDDVQGLQTALDRSVGAAVNAGISETDYERVQSKIWGDLARAFNTPDGIARMLVSHHFRGTSLPDAHAVLGELTVADLNERLRAMLRSDARAYCAIVPK